MRDTRVQRRSNIHAQFRRGKWEFGAEERKERDISATMSATQRAHAHPSSVSRKQVNPLSPSPATSTGPW